MKKSILEVEEFMGKKVPTRKFYILKTKIFSKEFAEKINLDIDPKGGLKIVHLKEKFDLNCVGGFKTKLILDNIKEDFIPIVGKNYNAHILKLDYGEEIEIDEIYHNILSNNSLSKKDKYILLDGIPQKVKYLKTYFFEVGLNEYKDFIYSIV